MQLKTRLLITNILMIIIPVILMIATMLSLPTLYQDFAEPQGIPNVFEAVQLLDGAGEKLQSNPELALAELAGSLGEIGFQLVAYTDSSLIYSSSTQVDLDSLQTLQEAAGQNSDKFMLLNDNQLIYQRDFLLGEEVVSFLAINNSPGAGALIQRIGQLSSGGFSRPIALLSLFFIALTNGLLAWVIIRSVMKPLNKLSFYARKIKDGDLDTPATYLEKDEFAPVFEDFEDMRSRLKSSVELQQQYEEGRKELLAGISHDLRTPITAIKGYVSGLKDGIADTPEKREKYLNTIFKTTWTLDSLVDQLFLLSKLDLNKVPFYNEPVDMVAYFQDCVADLGLDLEKEGMEISFVTNCTNPVANIDRNQFRRVVLNLVNNSVKFKQGPSGYIEIALDCTEDYIYISFSDDGKGIRPEEAEKVFESFYRGNPARTDTGQGSGLGLAIARRIIEQQGGKISAKSSRGRGMTITIQLPRVRREECEDHPNHRRR